MLVLNDATLKDGVLSLPVDDILIGESQCMRNLKTQVCHIAQVESNVLITGETGTGKELVAELIHHYSQRNSGSLICINCAAIPDSLLESELFGHEKGSFTGANQSRHGMFKLANKGSLLLDEVGDMSLQAQAKILRAIESNMILPVGGDEPVQVDVRYIAATNQDLEKSVQEKRFRADLFYRLNVARIQLPALRERRGDIVLLCEAFIKKFNKSLGMNVKGMSDAVVKMLNRYDWPGNVRQLKNTIEASFINRPGRLIDVDDLPAWFMKMVSPASSSHAANIDEKMRLSEAMELCDGNKSQAAKFLNVSRMTLYRKLQKYKIFS